MQETNNTAKREYFFEPAFEGTDRCILFSANDGFIAPLAVMIRSIADHMSADRYYDIVIMHRDITEAHQDMVRGMAEGTDNLSIRFLDLTEYTAGISFYTANRETLTEETYYRLYAPWVLSKGYRYALYLDADMLVRRDVGELLYLDIGDSYIAALRDYWGICSVYKPGSDFAEYRKSIGLTDLDGYIIAGTILFDLDQFRELFSLEGILRLATETNWRQHDQDVVNILCAGHIHYIGPEWGMVTDYGDNMYLPDYLRRDLMISPDEVAIVHYAGSRKPWHRMIHPYGADFWKTAQTTVFFRELLDRIKKTDIRVMVARALDPQGITVQEETDENGQVRYQRSWGDFDLGEMGQDYCRVSDVRLSDGKLRIEGTARYYWTPDGETPDLCLRAGSRSFVLDRTIEEIREEEGDYTYTEIRFRGAFDASDGLTGKKLRLVSTIGSREIPVKKITYGRLSGLNRKQRHDYICRGGYALRVFKDHFSIIRCSHAKRWKLEIRNIGEIVFSKKPYRLKGIMYRLLSLLWQTDPDREIWLVSDRLAQAGDNGEAFYDYLMKENARQKYFFVIDRNCSDAKRLSQKGFRIVQPGSFRHKILLLKARKVIGSQTDIIFRNPWYQDERATEILRSLIFTTDFVFVHSGMLQTDCSKLLSRTEQIISAFAVSTQQEKEELLKASYGYPDEAVIISGQPKWDSLGDSREKIICIMPTWRRYLVTGQDTRDGRWKPVDDFAGSRYAEFYRNIATDSRLAEEAKRLGYRIWLRLHPSFSEEAFEALGLSDTVEIKGRDMTYAEIVSKGALLVTDYSAAACDFALLRKPVIYAQFDREEFFSGKHMVSQGAFDFEKDGFGEIVSTEDDLITRVIEYMQSDCRMKEEYRRRADEMFGDNDRKNSARIYSAIE